jgi:hypothetical protein
MKETYILTAILLSMTSPKNPAPRQKIEDVVNVPPAISSTLRRACYDCHSYETKWPWYSSAPVIGAMIRDDVEKGRQVMNFSDWRPENQPLLAAACAVMQSGDMPKGPYLMLHPDARLSASDKQAFCTWAKSVPKHPSLRATVKIAQQ